MVASGGVARGIRCGAPSPGARPARVHAATTAVASIFLTTCPPRCAPTVVSLGLPCVLTFTARRSSGTARALAISVAAVCERSIANRIFGEVSTYLLARSWGAAAILQ